MPFATSPSRVTARKSARLAAIAASSGLAIIAGFAERDGAVIYNSAVFTDGRTEAAHLPQIASLWRL